MSYEHCDRHDVDATNGCLHCEIEALEAQHFGPLVVRPSIHGTIDVELAGHTITLNATESWNLGGWLSRAGEIMHYATTVPLGHHAHPDARHPGMGMKARGSSS